MVLNLLYCNCQKEGDIRQVSIGIIIIKALLHFTSWSVRDPLYATPQIHPVCRPQTNRLDRGRQRLTHKFDRQTDRQTDRQIRQWQTDRLTDKFDRQTNRLDSDRQTNRLDSDRQTDRLTDPS